MKISLDKPELEAFINAQVKAGSFASAQEVIEAAVARLMLDPREDELDDETLAAIDEAEAQYQRGEVRPWSEVRAELKAKYINK